MTEPARLRVPNLPAQTLHERIKAIKREYPVESPLGPMFAELAERPWSHDPVFAGLDPSEEDELYPEAEKVVREAGKASTSFIQRKLGIGYARSAHIMDMLTERGVIEEPNGSMPRKVIERDS
jgi:DNA segregation ATPase FtsK/SpoIIIE-like protein